ncbi:MAG: SigB/SigF/SigG family RNA polymerase sigma factor [Lachnospiraceae bacterium]|nr:SigB/SigF/SigG family RNA polymerase sigma factor [Lachnospiraceae bacterium]
MEEISVLLAKAHAGDVNARELLIEKNLGLVHAVVSRFLGRGVEREDLFQIGVIGLMKAIDRFDLSYDVKFSTYAVPLITGEIKRFFRDDGPVKISRSIKEQAYRVQKAREALQGKLGTEPTLKELVAETGLSLDEVIVALEAGGPVESLYAPAYGEEKDSAYLVDTIRSTDNGEEKMLNHMLLGSLLNGLAPRERQMIVHRYFENKTQCQVAQLLGMSQVQVSRMEKKVLLHMRKEAGEDIH